MKKTWKTEMAILFAIGLTTLIVATALEDDPVLSADRRALIEIIIFPVLMFIATALGMSWVTHQTDWGGKPDDLMGD